MLKREVMLLHCDVGLRVGLSGRWWLGVLADLVLLSK